MPTISTISTNLLGEGFDVEDYYNWCWFIELSSTSLNTSTGKGYSFVFYRLKVSHFHIKFRCTSLNCCFIVLTTLHFYKGLIGALRTILPKASTSFYWGQL